jgi:hypothetical protein
MSAGEQQNPLRAWSADPWVLGELLFGVRHGQVQARPQIPAPLLDHAIGGGSEPLCAFVDADCSAVAGDGPQGGERRVQDVGRVEADALFEHSIRLEAALVVCEIADLLPDDQSKGIRSRRFRGLPVKAFEAADEPFEPGSASAYSLRLELRRDRHCRDQFASARTNVSTKSLALIRLSVSLTPTTNAP